MYESFTGQTATIQIQPESVLPCAISLPIPRQEGGRTFAELVRGEDRFRNFDTPTPPTVEMGEEEWAIQQESLTRLNSILLDGAVQQSKVSGHQPYV